MTDNIFNVTLEDQPPTESESKALAIYHKNFAVLRQDLDTIKTAIHLMEKKCLTLSIVDDKTQNEISAIYGQAQKFLKEIEKKRKLTIEEPSELVNAVNKFCRPIKDDLDKVKRLSTDKVKQYEADKQKKLNELRKQQEEQRKALQAKVDKEAKEAGVESAIVPEVVIEEDKKTRTESGTTIYKTKTWTYEEVDLAKVPHEYLVLNVQKVKDAIKFGIRSIEGLRIYEKEETKMRS